MKQDTIDKAMGIALTVFLIVMTVSIPAVVVMAIDQDLDTQECQLKEGDR